MPAKRILVLGGTTEARDAADALKLLGHHVVFSLAGVTQEPILPHVIVRRGGFGGAAGLADYLRSEKVDVVLDATHPFAAIMSRQAYEACVEVDCSLVRLERPAWVPESSDRWISVDSLVEASQALPAGAHVLLTTGRKDLNSFITRNDISGLIRTIEAPAEILPPHWQLLQDRPPFTLESEMSLIQRNAITHLVSKNAGSHATEAKLFAARVLGIAVVMIRRPAKPQCIHFADLTSLLEQQTLWLGSSKT